MYWEPGKFWVNISSMLYIISHEKKNFFFNLKKTWRLK